MTSLLCNSYNGCASSSSQKLKFLGALLFVIVVYSKQTAGEGRSLAKGNKDCLVDLSFGVNKDAAEEEHEASEREHKCRYEL